MNQPRGKQGELPYEEHTRYLMGIKRYREALLVAAKWVEARPEDFAAWYYKGYAELNINRPQQALVSMERADQLCQRPNHMILLLKAHILGAIGRTLDAIKISDHLLTWPDLPGTALHQLGTVMSNIGDHRRAIELFEQALDRDGPNAGYYSSLATELHMVGRSDDAVQMHKKALEIDPKNFRGFWLLGQIKRATRENNYVDLFDRVLAENSDALQARICMNYALAKQHEELGNYDQAFKHLQAGAAGVLEHTPYPADNDRKLGNAIKTNFNDALFAQPVSHDLGEEIIFIVGMPRTGTTLLEQIITTYDGIETAGELHHMTHLLNNAYGTINPDPTIETMYQGVDQVHWDKLGEAYIKRARVHVPDSPVIIDKYPLNFFMLGAIMKALPKARIINLQRHPMDTCFSNYKLLFRLGSALQTYDLLTMGEYYCRYTDLMAHWHRLAPGRILDVSYERLVTDPEVETRRVTDYLGLEWRPECLEFYKSDSVVATASVSQVRRPIYTGSLYKWKKFERQLQPLADYFRQQGVDIETQSGGIKRGS